MEASAASTPVRIAPPPIGALGTELAKLHERPMAVSLGVAAVVALAGPLIVLNSLPTTQLDPRQVIAWIWFAGAVCIGSFVAGALTAAALPTVLLGARDRKASATHAWIGARDTRRILGSTTAAITIPTTPDEAERWLATQPDVPRLLPLRIDLLVLTGRFDEARSQIGRLPRATALDAYRITEATALVDDQAGVDIDMEALRRQAGRFLDPVERAEAKASLAVFEARRAIGRSDWRAPLVAVRDEIPGSDVAILLRDLGWPIFRVLARWVVLPIAALILSIAAFVTALQLL